jgi:hypothetical protein
MAFQLLMAGVILLAAYVRAIAAMMVTVFGM